MRRRNAPIMRGPDFAMQPAADLHEAEARRYVRRYVGGEWPKIDLEVDLQATAWMAQASCASRPDVDFFRGSRGVKVCHQCPVEAQCLRYAMELGIMHGVWGGTTPTDRAHLSRPVPDGAVVYFAADADLTFIKIGTSTALRTRLAALRLEVLATEPGSYERETELHNRFGRYRIGNSERFFPGADLLAYINSLAVRQDAA